MSLRAFFRGSSVHDLLFIFSLLFAFSLHDSQLRRSSWFPISQRSLFRSPPFKPVVRYKCKCHRAAHTSLRPLMKRRWLYCLRVYFIDYSARESWQLSHSFYYRYTIWRVTMFYNVSRWILISRISNYTQWKPLLSNNWLVYCVYLIFLCKHIK